nr:MAG TPA: hypothetical protein [Caudoviricetes sp.]
MFEVDLLFIGRVGGNEKRHPHGHPSPLVENHLKHYELLHRKYR